MATQAANRRNQIELLESQFSHLSIAFKTHLNQIQAQRSHKISIQTDQGKELIAVDLILRCEAQGNYTKIYLHDKRNYILSYTLKRVLLTISNASMIRIHQSHAVNEKYIRRIIYTGARMVELKCGTQIPISRRKHKEVMRRIFT